MRHCNNSKRGNRSKNFYDVLLFKKGWVVAAFLVIVFIVVVVNIFVVVIKF